MSVIKLQVLSVVSAGLAGYLVQVFPSETRQMEKTTTTRLELAMALESAEKLHSQTMSLASGISQLVSRTPFLRALLCHVTDKSEAAVFDLMERFMAVSRALGSVLSRVEAVRSKVDGSAEGSVSAVVAAAWAASSAEAVVMHAFIVAFGCRTCGPGG